KTGNYFLRNLCRQFLRGSAKNADIAVADISPTPAKMIGAFAPDECKLDFLIAAVFSNERFRGTNQIGIVSATQAAVGSKQNQMNFLFFARLQQRMSLTGDAGGN